MGREGGSDEMVTESPHFIFRTLISPENEEICFHHPFLVDDRKGGYGDPAPYLLSVPPSSSYCRQDFFQINKKSPDCSVAAVAILFPCLLSGLGEQRTQRTSKEII